MCVISQLHTKLNFVCIHIFLKVEDFEWGSSYMHGHVTFSEVIRTGRCDSSTMTHGVSRLAQYTGTL